MALSLLRLRCLVARLLLLVPLGAAQGVVPGKAFDRFVTIWLENQDFDKVIADPHFADLRSQGVLLTGYYAQTHPSQPNYIAAVGGDYFGLDHDDFVRIPENVSTVVDLLDTRGISWRGYFEDLPGPGYMARGSDGSTGNGGWDYVRKHNPFISYDSVNTNGSRLLNIQSFGAFARDAAARRLPQYLFMSPNMMNDGHNTTLGFATEWSRHFLEPLLVDGSGVFNNASEGERTLVALTYDESEDYGRPNHIATLLLGSAVPAELRGTQDDTFYTHYSLLATVEYNWELPCLGRYDVGANVLDLVLRLGGGGYANHRPANADSVDNSVSYGGALHSPGGGTGYRFEPVPPPNLKLTGAGGKPVLDAVREAWAAMAGADSPYDGSGEVRDGVKNLPVYGPQVANVR